MNGLTDLGLHKMQEHLDFYIKAVNSGEKSFSDAFVSGTGIALLVSVHSVKENVLSHLFFPFSF